MGGVPTFSLQGRKALQNPSSGQIIFCTDCKTDGEFQLFNGIKWVNAIGNQTADVPVLVERLSVQVRDIAQLDFKPDSNSVPFEAIFEPSNASNQVVNWTVSDTTIASINAQGILLVKGNGEVVVTASATDTSGVSASLTLSFLAEKPDNVVAEGIKAFADTTVLIDDVRQLYAAVLPFSSVDTSAVWRSLTDSILTVTTNGQFTALAEGTGYIELSSLDYPAFKDTIMISVYTLLDTSDKEPPILTIVGYDGENPVKVQRFGMDSLPFATAIDSVDGVVNITSVFDTAFNAQPYNDSILTDYQIIYSAQDLSSNEIRDTVLISVVDELPPVIKIDSGYVNADSLFKNNRDLWTIPYAVAKDEDSSNIAVNIDSSNVSRLLAGQYVINYSATDAQGNNVQDSLTVFIADSLAPVISVNGYNNKDTVFVVQGDTFNIPTAISIDETGDTVLTLINTGGFELNAAGTFNVTYQAQDANKNIANFSLVVIGQDVIAPEILGVTDEQIIVTFQESDTIVFNEIIATDNVGIVNYEVIEVDFLGNPILAGSDAYFESWLGNGGAIYVNDSGYLEMVKLPSNFEFNYSFRLVVTDAAGLSDTAIVPVQYQTGQFKDLRAKTSKFTSWVQVFSNGNSRSFDLNINAYEVGDTLLFYRAASSGFSVLDTVILNAGGGAEDFDVVSNQAAFYEDYFLVLKTPLDTNRNPNYNLSFDIRELNTQSLTPFEINLNLKGAAELSPSIDSLFPLQQTEALTLRDLLFNSATLSSIACPLDFASGIAGDLADGLDVVVTSLPIIPEDTARAAAKRMITQLPAYFWLSKDGPLTRINMKIPVKGKTLTIEYVIDNARNGCYWVALLDKLKPSAVSSRLSFLDGNTQAGIVVNTLAINEKNFECVKIPCLELNPGAHLVAMGNPIKSTGGEMAQAIVDPKGFVRVTPLAAGFNDPNLLMTLGLKTEFKTEFDAELVRRMDLASLAAQTALKSARSAVDLAQGTANAAINRVSFYTNGIADLNRIIGPAEATVQRLSSTAGQLANAFTSILNEVDAILSDDEICTPGICLTPCFIPSSCSFNCGLFTCYYPCVRSCGCAVRAPELCVPNPVAAALAATLGDDVNAARQAYRYAANQLFFAQQKLNELIQRRASFQSALAVAQEAVNAANQGVNEATAQLNQLNLDGGKLNDLAKFMLDNFVNATVATSNIIFETTIASAENGSFEGTLTFDVDLLGKVNTKITLPNFSFNGNQIGAAVGRVVDVLIDQIPD